jgi:hypothetical protein
MLHRCHSLGCLIELRGFAHRVGASADLEFGLELHDGSAGGVMVETMARDIIRMQSSFAGHIRIMAGHAINRPAFPEARSAPIHSTHPRDEQ